MEREKINWKEIIKVGNKIRIREFDDMEKQYGYRYVDDFKVINVYMSFTEDMKKICGDVINIDEEIEKNYEKRGYFYYQGFSISTDMLEPYEEELDVINIPVKDEYLKDSHNEEFEYKEETEENNLYKQLKGKYIKIKSWEEIKEKAWEIDEYDDKDYYDVKVAPHNWFTHEMRHLCGRVIFVDEDMISKEDFKDGKLRLIPDRELLYYDKDTDSYFYLDKNVFDVIDPKAKMVLEEEKQEKEISYLGKEWGIKDNMLYGIIYESEQTGDRKFFGKIINFNPYQVFMIDEKLGLTILSIKNITSMIPLKEDK